MVVVLGLNKIGLYRVSPRAKMTLYGVFGGSATAGGTPIGPWVTIRGIRSVPRVCMEVSERETSLTMWMSPSRGVADKV